MTPVHPVPPDPADVREAKRALRRLMRERARTYPPERREEDSARVRAWIRGSRLWRQARAVFLFAPMTDEVDVWPLVEEALASGRALALPRHDAASDTYLPVRVEDLTTEVRPGAFGIREPVAACPVFPPNQLDLTLLSGLAFDHEGRRLGRGKGYYDRLLPKLQGVPCGVAMDWQIVPSIPVGARDRTVNYVVTPAGWFAAGRAVEA